MQQFARAELPKRAFFTLEKASLLKLKKKTGKEEEQSAAYYSYRIFVTIDIELLVILVIDLLIFTKLCISCTCLLQDNFRPSEVSIFNLAQVVTINNFWKNIACNRYKNIPRSWVVTHYESI